jgi:hypothetical protein
VVPEVQLYAVSERAPYPVYSSTASKFNMRVRYGRTTVLYTISHNLTTLYTVQLPELPNEDDMTLDHIYNHI